MLLCYVTMVTKIHVEERWTTSSPISAILKLSKSAPRDVRVTGSPRNKSVSFSPQRRLTPQPSSSKKVQQFGWVKPNNPRRSYQYECHAYHCWVCITVEI